MKRSNNERMLSWIKEMRDEIRSMIAIAEDPEIKGALERARDELECAGDLSRNRGHHD